MKISTNKSELIKLNACCSGLKTFVEAHGEKEVLFSECLSSNGWSDVWWLISSVYSQLSQDQKDELSLIGCDWAERALVYFESEFPNDDRPRKAIEAKRRYIKGEISKSELEDEGRTTAEEEEVTAGTAGAAAEAELAAEVTVWAVSRTTAAEAEWAAEAAAWAAEARSAESRSAESWVLAVESRAAARAAIMKEMNAELMGLFLKWESKK